MLELSPLVTAASASARSMPAFTNRSRSKPMPMKRSAREVGPQALERGRLAVDDGNGVPLVDQVVRERRPHPAAPHDHYMHDSKPPC
jgi:hypothetical protein